MTTWEHITETIDRMPSAAWLVLIVVNLLVLAATWKAARRRMHRAGQRTANPDLVAGRAKTKDTALTVASMIPAAMFWAVVLAGSARGLIAFGRDTLGWRDGWEYLVPGSLDGVAVAFAFLAFRAVRKQKAPDRCYRVVWGAAIASAMVNFNYEYEASGHNLIAGGYLALLSLFGMVMFHEFLHQFEEGTSYIKREKPAFGIRWITWPTNTFCAWVAWHNHPPAKGTAATVRNAVANLERVRELKHAEREAATRAEHERALAQAQRRAELAAAKAATQTPKEDAVAAPSSANGRPGKQTPVTAPVPLPPEHTAPDSPPASAESSTSTLPTEVKVPSTAWRTRKWIETWVTMCADGDLVLGPLNNEQHARNTFDLSAKQLRTIRHAATSGALRRRAENLGIPLPPGYVDDPSALVNGKKPMHVLS